MLITFADLAQLKNVSRSAVSQRKSTGILDGAIVKHNGKTLLNKDLAMELWDKNTGPVLNQIPENYESANSKD